jgi:AcrR family transcriptional regulator
MTEDPRVERSRQVVRDAVLDELADTGYGALSIEGVARRAGVGKSTVYRHWPDKAALVVDALEHAHVGLVPDLSSGTARDKVVRLVEHVAEVVTDPRFSRCIATLVDGAERDARLREFHHRYSAARRAELASVITTGVDTGDFDRATDVDAAVVTILGVVFYRRLMTPDPVAPADAAAIVTAALPTPPPTRVTKSAGRGSGSR